MHLAAMAVGISGKYSPKPSVSRYVRDGPQQTRRSDCTTSDRRDDLRENRSKVNGFLCHHDRFPVWQSRRLSACRLLA